MSVIEKVYELLIIRKGVPTVFVWSILNIYDLLWWVITIMRVKHTEVFDSNWNSHWRFISTSMETGEMTVTRLLNLNNCSSSAVDI